MDYINEYIEKNPNMHLEHSNDKVIQLLAVLPKNKRYNRILDVACGAGAITLAFAKSLVPKYIEGIDISPTMINKAIQLDKEEKVIWKIMDIFQYPTIPERYDLIVCADIVEHLHDDAKFFEKLKILGKAVVIKVPLEDSIVTKIIRYTKISDPWKDTEIRYGHIHHYSVDTLDRVIINSGLGIKNVGYAYMPKRTKLLWEFLRIFCYPLIILGKRNLVRIVGGFKIYYLESTD